MELIQWYHVWAFTKVEGIAKFITMISAISWIALVIFGIGLLFYCVDECKPYPKVKMSIFLAWCLMISLVCSILPTQKEIAAIYLIPKIVNSETAQTFAKEASGLPTEFVKLIKTKMDEWVTDSLATQAKAVAGDAKAAATDAVKEVGKEVLKEVKN